MVSASRLPTEAEQLVSDPVRHANLVPRLCSSLQAAGLGTPAAREAVQALSVFFADHQDLLQVCVWTLLPLYVSLQANLRLRKHPVLAAVPQRLQVSPVARRHLSPMQTPALRQRTTFGFIGRAAHSPACCYTCCPPSWSCRCVLWSMSHLLLC